MAGWGYPVNNQPYDPDPDEPYSDLASQPDDHLPKPTLVTNSVPDMRPMAAVSLEPQPDDRQELREVIDEILRKHEENRFANGDINNRKYTRCAIIEAVTRHTDSLVDAILEEKPLTTVNGAVNVWEERIKRFKSTGQGEKK